MHLGKPYEFVMGAGAMAMVVSAEPRLLELELGKSGVHTHEVSDLTRPTSRVETGNSETSLLSYLDAIDGAFSAYLERVGEKISYDYFVRNIYHVPFGGMTVRASRAALRHFGDISRPDAERIWRKKTAPSLAYLRRMGGTYASSTFIALTTLLEREAELKRGDRIGMFSYGSGSCAELYSGLVGEGAREVAVAAKLGELLDARHSLTVREYEDAERERTAYIDCGDFEPSTDGFGGLFDRVYKGSGRLVFQGAREHYRQYGWS
jgi:hydroxymethylglutaryl-CoA synthase